MPKVTPGRLQPGFGRSREGSSSFEQAAYLVCVGALEDSFFGEERAHQRGRGDIERRIGDRYSLGRPAHAGVAGNLRGSTLFDGIDPPSGDEVSMLESGAAT